MAQTAAAPIHLPFPLLQMIMPLPPDTRRGPIVYVLCLSYLLSRTLFFPFVVPVTGDDLLGDIFFIPVLRLCCLSRFSCAFYLTNIYCKVVCCYPISVLTLFFFISACIGQSRSLPRSLTTRTRHTLFVSFRFFYCFSR